MTAIVVAERHHAADRIGAEGAFQATVEAMLVIHHHADPAPAGVVAGAVDGVPEAVGRGGRQAGVGEAARPVHAAVGILAGEADVRHQAVQVLGGVGAEADRVGSLRQGRNAVRLGDIDQRQLFHGGLLSGVTRQIREHPATQACRGRHAARQAAMRSARWTEPAAWGTMPPMGQGNGYKIRRAGDADALGNMVMETATGQAQQLEAKSGGSRAGVRPG